MAPIFRKKAQKSLNIETYIDFISNFLTYIYKGVIAIKVLFSKLHNRLLLTNMAL